MSNTIILFIVCLVVTILGFICALYLRKFILTMKIKYKEKHEHKQAKKISKMKAKIVREPKSKERRKYHG